MTPLDRSKPLRLEVDLGYLPQAHSSRVKSHRSQTLVADHQARDHSFPLDQPGLRLRPVDFRLPQESGLLRRRPALKNRVGRGKSFNFMEITNLSYFTILGQDR